MTNTATRTARQVPAISDLPTGTLVTVQPLPQFPRIPSGSGVVVDAFGPVETSSTVLVWFWGQGQPEPGKKRARDLPGGSDRADHHPGDHARGAFESIARGLDGEESRRVPDLAPLSARVEAARAQREHRDR